MSSKNNVLRIARKEFSAFFTSPIAFIFLGTFLAVTLFTFFWVETFFARNIADVRPMFEWMPILLIFLVSAITMRMWSEERRSGTLEFLLTSPVNPVHFVLGKFLACLGLVAVALLLTLPLPITVSFLGELDWGPVLGGYVATMFLAAAYAAIGLFISARSENQIVSLILAAVVCGLFYLLGSNALTDLFGNQASEILKLIGSGSRFESITRGVLDLRDIYYYLSLVGLFLTLNVFVLEWLRWSGNPGNARHKRWGVTTVLLAANFLAANLWLTPISWARADVTEGNIYSISDVTRNYLAQLREPLLIRGYFSAQTHPLLAPLIPQLRDLMKEYEIAGKGKVRIEIIDPAEDPKLEQEAGETYGIKPVPFQIASRYKASVVNSYFDILVKYGDQHEVLNFQDLIEFKAYGPENVDVRLRNPEYDLTEAVKKVLYAYQASGQLFSNIQHPVHFKGYISPNDKLPKELVDLKKSLDEVLADFKKQAGDKLTVDIVDPDANGGELAKQLQQDFGFRPLSANIFSNDAFWFYMTMESDGQTAQIALPENLTKAGLKEGIEAGLKRFSKGFLKTVALHKPAEGGMPGMPPNPSAKQFGWLESRLGQEYNVVPTDLNSGFVPPDADILVLLAPENLNDKQVFAVDQFLMQGGTVIASTAPYDIDVNQSLSAHKHHSGLEDWLAHNGITIEDKLVMDAQNSAFPIPVQRRLGGFTVQETQMIDYPYFVDIRDDGMNSDSGLTAGLNQVTMNWPSPITIDEKKNTSRTVTPLLHSSERSWTSTSLDVEPNLNGGGFTAGAPEGRKLLAAAVEGSFESFFKGKPSPLVPKATDDDKDKDKNASDNANPAIERVIEKSPESARIIVFASNSFLTNTLLSIASRGLGTQYINPVQLASNAIDWSLEDRGLLSIRGRAHFSRTLTPLDKDAQMFWEYLNYGLALLGLVVVWLVRRQTNKRTRNHYKAVLAS